MYKLPFSPSWLEYLCGYEFMYAMQLRPQYQTVEYCRALGESLIDGTSHWVPN